MNLYNLENVAARFGCNVGPEIGVFVAGLFMLGGGAASGFASTNNVSHPADGLDEVVHQRTRLGILAVLAEGGRGQFGVPAGRLDPQ